MGKNLETQKSGNTKIWKHKIWKHKNLERQIQKHKNLETPKIWKLKNPEAPKSGDIKISKYQNLETPKSGNTKIWKHKIRKNNAKYLPKYVKNKQNKFYFLTNIFAKKIFF